MDNNKSIDKKKQLLSQIAEEIQTKSKKYYRLSKKYKSIDDFFEIATQFFNTLSLSSIIVLISIQSENYKTAFLVTSTISSTIGLLLSVTKRAYSVREKLDRFKTSWCNFSDLSRELRITLVRNHLSIEDFENLANSFNLRISIIEDSQLPA